MCNFSVLISAADVHLKTCHARCLLIVFVIFIWRFLFRSSFFFFVGGGGGKKGEGARSVNAVTTTSSVHPPASQTSLQLRCLVSCVHILRHDGAVRREGWRGWYG